LLFTLQCTSIQIFGEPGSQTCVDRCPNSYWRSRARRLRAAGAACRPCPSRRPGPGRATRPEATHAEVVLAPRGLEAYATACRVPAAPRRTLPVRSVGRRLSRPRVRPGPLLIPCDPLEHRHVTYKRDDRFPRACEPPPRRLPLRRARICRRRAKLPLGSSLRPFGLSNTSTRPHRS
jgi:hypothetical protein